MRPTESKLLNSIQNKEKFNICSVPHEKTCIPRLLKSECKFFVKMIGRDILMIGIEILSVIMRRDKKVLFEYL